VIALISLLMAAAVGVAPADPCVALVPKDLARKLEIRFPGSRLPLATDSDEENRQFTAGKGNTCLSIARGDFDGKGRADLVLILPAKSGNTYQLVVALGRPDGFDVQELGSWKGSMRRLYVDVATPGTYRHTEAYPFRPAPGFAEKIVSQRQGFYFGQVEAAADVYFLDHTQWLRVHVLD
jgi:hypothetical protein